VWYRTFTKRPLLIRDFSHYRIENPLIRFTPEQLLQDVRQFTRKAHLDDERQLLERAAQLAKDPRHFVRSQNVTKEEKVALQDERTRRFNQPPALYLTIIVCSIGAAVQ
ncbi:MAG: hypothetical protein Q9174_006061, partial [Haloplaca sp. 1 TL-2023]